MWARMTANDLDLLRDFARDQSQDAFTALVRRHLDLVYCAALRQVRSPQLAEEVAQSVFTDLARLYQVTRRTAIDVVRRESRRQLREQIAFEMNAMNATADDWTHIEPLLDDTDRTAVLLRYFEKKSLREVGETLGTTDDAARKRISRAVECLRDFFAKQGVNVGASGLVVGISANAVQAAPVGLAVTISTAAAFAGTTITTSTATVTAAKTIVMTTLQKTLIAVAVIIVGVGTTLVIQQRVRSRTLGASQSGLAQSQTTVGSSSKATQMEFPQASWKFAGYADPESGYQSLIWAMSQGDVEITHDSLTPDARAKWEKNGPPRSKGEKDERMARRTKQTELYRILDKQSVSDTETHLRIESIGASNENPVHEQWARMIKVGRNWKFEGYN